jgi:hypothetical protein
MLVFVIPECNVSVFWHEIAKAVNTKTGKISFFIKQNLIQIEIISG